MSRISATFLIALGDFGAEVAARLRGHLRTRADERRPDLSVVELPLAGRDRAKVLELTESRLVEEVRAQLALGALVDRGPQESSLPWLDVLIAADLSEPTTCDLLPDLLDRVRDVVSRRFPNILGRGADRVVVVPLLALVADDEPTSAPRQGSGDEGSCRPELAETLERLASREQPRVRSFLLEPQTSRYILSREELVSTVAAIIELLVLADLRESEHLSSFLRDETPRAGSSKEPAPFGTFGVASVHVDGDLVLSYCQNRASLSLVSALRSVPDIGLAEREEMARELRLPFDEVRDQLGLASQSDAAFDQVEKIVLEEAPTFPCPEIDRDDSPEDIRERKFGDDWYRTVGGAIDQLIERLERRRMHELSGKIDAQGLSLSRRRRQVVRETVDDWVWSAPRGWSDARSTLALLRDEMGRAEEEASQRIEQISLPPMPTPEQLHTPVLALRDETERRPRPFRLWLLGTLLVLAAVFFGYPLLSLLVYLLLAINAPLWLIEAFRPPQVMAIAAVIAIPAVVLSLRSMVRRRHQELVEVRDELKRSIERLVSGRSGSVLSYYLARLELARELWILRLARSERRLFEEELARLDEVQRALDTLWDRYRAAQRQLGVRYLDDTSTVEDLSSIVSKGDLILREAADGELLASTYAVAARDEEDLAREFFDELAAERPQWRRELPMADQRRVGAFLEKQLEVPSPGELLSGAQGIGNDTAQQAVEKVLLDLSTRLAPSLGLTEGAIQSNSSMIIWAPEAAGPVVDKALGEIRGRLDLEALGSDWLRLTSPRDDGRVYLAALVTHLPRAAIGALSR